MTAADRRRGAAVATVLRAAVSGPAAEPADRDLARPVLERSGCTAIAWWGERGGDPDDPDAAERRAFARDQSIRHPLAAAAATEAVEALRARGLTPLLGKGLAAASWYPEPSVRAFGDIDLYVAPPEHAAAAEVVRSLGPRHGFEVDLHDGASYLDDRSWAELLDASGTVEAAGAALPAFGDADQLRLVCLHLAAEGAIRPQWLCDVAFGLRSIGDELDVDRLLAGDRRRTTWTRVVIGLAVDLLGATAPPEVARTPPAWVRREVLEVWGRAPLAKGQRRAFVRERGLREQFAAARLRWPNAVEAAYGTGAPLRVVPRSALRAADSVRRIGGHVARRASERRR